MRLQPAVVGWLEKGDVFPENEYFEIMIPNSTLSGNEKSLAMDVFSDGENILVISENIDFDTIRRWIDIDMASPKFVQWVNNPGVDLTGEVVNFFIDNEEEVVEID